MSLGGSLLRVGRHTLSTTPRYRVAAQLVYTSTVSRRFISSQGDAPSHLPTYWTDGLQTAIRRKDLAGIHRHYPKIWSAVVKDGHAIRQPILRRGGLVELLNVLASSGRPNDLALIEQIFKEMRPLFHIELTDKIHTVVVRALIKCGNVQTIYRWLMTTPQKTGHFTILNQWLLFLEHCLHTGDIGMMRQSLRTMQQSGCKPTNEVLKIIIRALFISNPRVRDFDRVFDDALREGLPFDQSVSTLLYDGFTNIRRVDRAVLVERIYKEKFPEPRLLTRVARHDRIRVEAQNRGVKAAVSMCSAFKTEGFQPNERTLTIILQYSTKLADMRYAEEQLHIRANLVHWSVLITNVVRLGDLPSALFIYGQSQEMGIRPDVAMVQPIISALCFPPLARPNEAAIDRALEIYRDLFHATSEQNPKGMTQSQARDAPLMGPNAPLYNILLRTLASAKNARKYVPKALALLDDMESRDVAMESSMVVASVTILLMRSTSNYAEAIYVFKRISNAKNGPGLDAKGYAAVLNAFCKLALDRSDLYPSVDYYFEIVDQMRRAGHNLTAEIYAILLRQLTQKSSNIRMSDLQAYIHKVHRLLLLDTSLSPDIVLWNQLMDAHQRAGSFSGAYQVWDMLFISGQYDNASVSVILDTCAFAKQWSTATDICARLFHAGFSFNQRNWNGWLECMCRLGQLDEAAKLMCLEMGKNQADIAPDVESVRIILKFSKGTNQEAEVRYYIKQYLPDLWESAIAEIRV